MALVALGLGCSHPAPLPRPGFRPAGERARIVILPVDNLTGRQIPKKELRAAIEASVGGDIDVVPVDEMEPFLSRHRVRFTGGVEPAAAAAAREELGADAVLITEIEVYRASEPPAVGIAMRLVTAEQEPSILWMDRASFAGDEAPGLLNLGIVHDVKEVERRVLRHLTAGLTSALAGGLPPSLVTCQAGGRFKPKVHFRAAGFDDDRRYRLAVVPFLNSSGRRGAGDAVALEFIRQLDATGRYDVVEPGVLREYLLRARVMMPGGVSLETTRLLLGTFGVDVVVSGQVLEYDDGVPSPKLRFTATMFDTATGEVVWHSTSYSRGDDGVWAFGLGRVATASALSCGMVAGVVDRMAPNAAAATPRREISDSRLRFGMLRRPGDPSRDRFGR